MTARRLRAFLRLEEGLLLLAVAVNVAVALSVRHFPYQDVINHLARYALIARTLEGHGPDWIVFRPVPTAYFGGDLLGAASVHLLGPDTTLRLLAVLPLLLLPFGLYALLRVTAPSQTGWALVGALMSFSIYYLQGLTSYTIGLGLTLLWLSWWWPRRSSTRLRDRLLLALSCVMLYFVHLSAPLIVIGVVGLDYLHQALADRRDGLTGKAAWLNARLAMTVTISVAVAVVWVGSQIVTWHEPIIPPVAEFRPWPKKLKNLGYPFYAFSLSQFAVMAAAYALAAGYFVFRRLPHLRGSAFLWCGPAFVVLYLVSPANSAADVRWLPMAYLLPFCAIGDGRRVPAAVLLAIFALTLAHAGVIHQRATRIDPELGRYEAVLATIPSEARVLPVVSDHFRDGRVRPYYHFALWLTVRKGTRVAGLFARDGVLEGQETWRHFDHFRLRPPFFALPYDWGSRLYTPLDCVNIREHFDIIVQAGRDDLAAARIRACATDAEHVGEIWVYRVAPSATGK